MSTTTTVSEAETPTRPHLVIDPRIRQRWVEVRRQEGRRRLRVLAAVSVLVLMVGAALGVLHTPLVKVRHVRIATVPGIPASLVQRTAGLSGGALMVDVSASDDVRRLEALPVVATARVQRQWPGTVRVAVTARAAVAVVGAGATSLVLDRTGRVLSLGAPAPLGLPALKVQVTAAPVGGWLSGTAGPGATALAATDPTAAPTTGGPTSPLGTSLALAAALGDQPGNQVATITTVPADGLVATVGTTTVVFGDATQLPAKVVALAALLAHGPLTGLARVDLRVPDRPAAIPAPAHH